jgi:hypothetical protein
MRELPEDSDVLESLIRVEVAGFVSFARAPLAEPDDADWAIATVPQPATAAASARPETVWRRREIRIFLSRLLKDENVEL